MAVGLARGTRWPMRSQPMGLDRRGQERERGRERRSQEEGTCVCVREREMERGRERRSQEKGTAMADALNRWVSMGLNRSAWIWLVGLG